jgi:mRNA interferase MazF
LDPAIGTEIKKTRPAVLVSNDACNAFGARVVIVPVTSNVSSLYPGEARIHLRGKPARVMGDQMRSIDKRRLRGKIARLSTNELREVEIAIRITLDIR